MQPCLHSCRFKAKCGAIICIKNASTKVSWILLYHLHIKHCYKWVHVLCRYLSIRWAIDLSKVVLFVGEKGDTDYEDLLGGLHKTIVLKGSVAYGSGKLLRNEEDFKREDAVAQGNPNIKFVEISEGQNIAGALDALGIK